MRGVPSYGKLVSGLRPVGVPYDCSYADELFALVARGGSLSTRKVEVILEMLSIRENGRV
jgi:hypothetical protein